MREGVTGQNPVEEGEAPLSRAALAELDLTIPDPDAMERLGFRVGAVLRAGDLLVLTGPLGAGKTTFTRGLGDGLQVRGPATSPTFVIARTHPPLGDGPPLVHVDAYRLGSAVELDDLDIDFARSVVVVEWGAGMLDGVATSWLDVTLERPTGATDAAVEGEEPIEPRLVHFRGTGWV